MGTIPVSFSKEYKMYLLILLVARLGKFVECDTSSCTASMTGKAKDSWHGEGSREESRQVCWCYNIYLDKLEKHFNGLFTSVSEGG